MQNKKSNKKILVVLLIAVLALSIGFATFSSQLKIQTSGIVKPDKNTFRVRFSTSKTEESNTGNIVYDTEGHASGGAFDEDNTTITGLKANFTKPDQTATWEFYAYNAGEYDAYLNSITIGSITCSAVDDTNQDLVDATGNGINIKIQVGDSEYTTTNASISGHKLEKGNGEKIIITLTYPETETKADGDFNITIGDIRLQYDSID